MTDPLISVAELAADLGEPDPPVLLDVRWTLGGPPARELYEAGHIPGARFVDLETELAGPPGPGGRHPLPDVSDFEAAMRAHGVRNAGDVVVYDAADATAAARAWWLLRWAGHERTRVLDGGLRAWVAAGHPVVTAASPGAAGDFVARPGSMPTVTAEEAAQVARTGTLLDVRSPERHRGESEPVDPVAGHIPGARSFPASGNVEPDGRFRTPVQLRDRLGKAKTPVAAYCGSGVTATQTVLALHRAGIPAALYPGSWSHWITDPGRPVATNVVADD